MQDEDENEVKGPEENTLEVPQPPQLTAIELRVLGSLMEKQLTTPDQYPLTVNSIITACNQKSSREPISSYQQGEIVRTLQSLEDRHLVRKEYGSRADKYSQLFIQHLDLGKKHQALLCLMMLRGPQTISELSTRTQRMELFSDKDDLTHSLERLCERELPFAIRLGHQPGQRGERFGHLFCGMPEIGTLSASANHQSTGMSADDRDIVSLLESEMSDLNKTVQELKMENRELRQQLESLYELTGHSFPESQTSQDHEIDQAE